MIVIDKDMPKSWDDCEFNSNCECCLIDATCHDETSIDGEALPDFCPIVMEISQADVKKIQARDKAKNDFYNAFDYKRGGEE